MYGEPFQERLGVIVQDTFIYDLSDAVELEKPESIDEVLQFGLLSQIDELVNAIKPNAALTPLDAVRLGPPLAGMGKIVAVGLNYRDHAAEMGNPLPSSPLLFCKAPTSITGPTDDLMLPPETWSTEVDYEVELGVVIGDICREVDPEDAMAYVAGYTIVNDVTARDVQRAESQWFRAKSYDGFCPLGPFLVTRDEIEDVSALKVTTRVNGEIRQQSNTKNLIFSVTELVSFVSQCMTLLPGDIIATGTPAGIGAGMKPPCYLQPGDVVELSIDGLGSQRNTVVAYEPEE